MMLKQGYQVLLKFAPMEFDPCMLKGRYIVYLTGCDRSMDPRSS